MSIGSIHAIIPAMARFMDAPRRSRVVCVYVRERVRVCMIQKRERERERERKQSEKKKNSFSPAGGLAEYY